MYIRNRNQTWGRSLDTRNFPAINAEAAAAVPAGYFHITEGRVEIGDQSWNSNDCNFYPVSKIDIGNTVRCYVFLIRKESEGVKK